MLIDEGFAKDMKVINEDGTTEELYIAECKRRRCFTFDETDHPLSNEGDNGGPRSGTFIDPDLPRPGSSTTRGSRHVTEVVGNTAVGECLPSLFIFDSKATSFENYKVKPEWCQNLPTATGKWGFNSERTVSSFVGVTKSGSMTDFIFMQYIEKQILPLFPNVHPEWILTPDEKEVIQGPVLIKTDMGPGRLVADRANIEWRKRMRKKGVILFGSSPNATSVNAEMDDMFTSYKGHCKTSTQRCYNGNFIQECYK